MEEHITDTPNPTEGEKSIEWNKKDENARDVIGLTLSNEHLEHVKGIKSGYKMWKSIANLFQRRTILNRINVR